MADSKGRLNIERLTQTKIVCTLGPATSSLEVLTEMVQVGMDVVRLNFSHGSHDDHSKIFNMIRNLSAANDNQVSILCDIQGPKIRTGDMKEPFIIKSGDIIKVTPKEVLGTPEIIQIKYANIVKDLNPKDLIFINDGIIKLKIKGKTEDELICVCEAGGLISNKKGCNIPSGHLSLDVVQPKDKRDLEFIAKLDPEFIAASFVGTADDVRAVRKILKEFGNEKVKIISKIERPVALENIDAIIEESDGIMVARGDLGVEIPTWDVPAAQKLICKKCNKAGIPVIVATQMLESMTSSSRPTRAEASDVFNAVLDGADAVMLSGETSIGKYPVNAVKIMDNIIAVAEKEMLPRNPKEFHSTSLGKTEVLAATNYSIAQDFNKLGYTGKILVVTGPPSGYTARMVSKYRPALDVVAFAEDLRTARELNLLWGVRSVYTPVIHGCDSMEKRTISAIEKGLEMELISLDDHVLVFSRSLLGKHVGTTCGIYQVKTVIANIGKGVDSSTD